MQADVRSVRQRDFIRVATPETPRERLVRVVAEVAFQHDVELPQMFGRSRARDVVRARHHAMHRLHHDGLPYTQIGRFFGRDHTTVMHGVRQWDGRS